MIGVHDAIRAEAHDVIHDLRHLKIKEIAILTGDREPVARAVAKRVHADTVEAELLPADKARWIEERRQAGRRVAMVGDGINDAPALAQADAGIALGGVGADLAAEAGDMIIMGDPLRVLPDLLRLCSQDGRDHPPEHHRLRLRTQRRGDALGDVRHPRSGGRRDPPPGRFAPGVAQFDAAPGFWRLVRAAAAASKSWQLAAWISRLDERIDLEEAWQWIWGRRQIDRGDCRLACVILAYATSGWTVVGPDEVGVLQRFGRYRGSLGPGLAPALALSDRAGDERSRAIGCAAWRSAFARRPMTAASRCGGSRPMADRSDDADGDEALLLTGDGRYVELSATLQYAIDPIEPGRSRRFVFDVADGEAALRPLAESAVREVVGRRALLDLLTTRRREAEEAAARVAARAAAGLSVRHRRPRHLVSGHPSAAGGPRRLSRRLAGHQRSPAADQRGERLPRPGRDRGGGQGPGRSARRGSRPAELALASRPATRQLRLARDARRYGRRSPISAFSGRRWRGRWPAR